MAKVDLATYVAKIEVDHKGLHSGLQETDRAVEGSLNKTSKGMGLATKAMQAGVVATVAKLGKEVVKVGSSFEAGMSEVQAISGATGEDLNKLTEKAKEMGRTTKFSATEASEGLKYMAMAGWDTNDMLDGLDGVMMLAAASGEELSLVSDIVTDALSGFGMEAHQASEFADLLASTSSNSNTNVAMLGESFKYVAPLAGALGYSAEDTALALGLMANAGIKGSQAGTTLRNVMTGLTTPTKASAESMAALGIEVKNADGTLKPFNEVLVDMREKFDDLTPAQKAQHAQAIAGKQGMAGLLAIMEASPEEFEKLTQATTDYNGVAEEMAEIMGNNLVGSMDKFKSAVEGLAIEVYELIAPLLKLLVDIATILVEVLLESFMTLVQGVQEGLEPLGEIFDTLRETFRESFAFLGEAYERAQERFKELIDSIMEIVQVALEPLLLALNDTIEMFGGIVEAIWPVIEVIMELAQGVLLAVLEPAIMLISGLLEVLIETFNLLLEVVLDVVEGLIELLEKLVKENSEQLNRIAEIVGEITDLIVQIIRAVTDLLKKIINKFFKSTESDVDSSTDSIFKIIDTVLKAILDVVEFILNLIKDILDVVLKAIEGDWKGAWEGIKNIASNIWNGIKNVVDTGINAIKNLLSGAYSSMKRIAKELFKKIWDAAKEIFKSIIMWLPNKIRDIFNVFKRNNSAARRAGRDMFDSVWEGMKSIWLSIKNWVTDKVTWLTDKLTFWKSGKDEMRGGVPGFAVGTPFISRDTPAILHKGEAVIPANLNPFNPKNKIAGGFWNGKFGMGGAEGPGANYNVNVNIDRVESDVDIERAVAKGIEEAENKRKRRLKKKGL